MYSLGFSRQRSGSFPEQSNKMNERSISWRQTIKLSIFITESRLENRVTAGVTKKVRSLKWPGEVDRGLRSCEILHLFLRDSIERCLGNPWGSQFDEWATRSLLSGRSEEVGDGLPSTRLCISKPQANESMKSQPSPVLHCLFLRSSIDIIRDFAYNFIVSIICL